MVSTVANTKVTVRFSFKDPNYILEESKSQESLIFLFFSSSGMRFKYSTGYKSSYKDWDFSKQRIKEGKAGILNSREVNEFLARLETSLKRECSRIEAEGGVLTKEVLKSYLDSLTNKNVVYEKTKVLPTFFEFANSYIDGKGNQIAPVTRRVYKQSIAKLKSFEVFSGRPITFESFDKSFYLDFNNFMESKNFSLNTIGKHIRNIKVILNGAFDEGFINNVKFKSRDFKPKSEQTTAIYLTDEEIQRMYELDLSAHKQLELARDIFLIGCYTGQRVSDYNGLTSKAIKVIRGKKFISIHQKKTGSKVDVRLGNKIEMIMKSRYGGEMPPKMFEQEINESVKVIGEMLDLNTLVKVTSTRGGKLRTEMIPKYKLLHSHTARRSFCTNMYIDKMPIFDIMLFSGHKSEREFYKYIRIKDEERAFHVAESGFFDKY